MGEFPAEAKIKFAQDLWKVQQYTNHPYILSSVLGTGDVVR